MINLFNAPNGMNIVGQGGKIILFTLPFAISAIVLDVYLPEMASLPKGLYYLPACGFVLLFAGILLWGCAVIQLLIGFPKGRLITTGAYGICRNPIYSSMIVLILPAISLLTLTWVYLAVSLFLYIGVFIFIRKEETRLQEVFGDEYLDYKAKVSRIIPFFKPGS